MHTSSEDIVYVRGGGMGMEGYLLSPSSFNDFILPGAHVVIGTGHTGYAHLLYTDVPT